MIFAYCLSKFQRGFETSLGCQIYLCRRSTEAGETHEHHCWKSIPCHGSAGEDYQTAYFLKSSEILY